MSSIRTTDTERKNPSLKKHFKYMVNSRKQNVDFSSQKIRDIITIDLEIDFANFSDTLKDVSIEMFRFYNQSWPGWHPQEFQKCIDNFNESFDSYKQFLRDKILNLKTKQEWIHSQESTTLSETSNRRYHLELPADTDEHLPIDTSGKQVKRKTKFPYVLEITGEPEILNSLHFQVNILR